MGSGCNCKISAHVHPVVYILYTELSGDTLNQLGILILFSILHCVDYKTYKNFDLVIKLNTTP